MSRYKILTEKDVSEWLGIPENTLRTHRSRPPKNYTPIPFFHLPNGKIAYREDKIQQWIDNQDNADETRPYRKRAG